MPQRIGDATPARVYAGDSQLTRIYNGDSLMWSSFAPSRMTHNAAFTVTTGGSMVTGWAADTATHPGSTVVGNNGLAGQGAGAGVTATTTVLVSNGSFQSRTVDIVLRRNETEDLAWVLGAPLAAFASLVAVTVTAPGLSLNSGDRVGVFALASGASMTIPSNTGSFVRLFVP